MKPLKIQVEDRIVMREGMRRMPWFPPTRNWHYELAVLVRSEDAGWEPVLARGAPISFFIAANTGSLWG